MNFIIMPMFFLSGAMYPVKLLPEILRIVAKANPLTYGIDAIKYILLPADSGAMGPDFSIVTSIAAILITSIIFLFISARAFERKA